MVDEQDEEELPSTYDPNETLIVSTADDKSAFIKYVFEELEKWDVSKDIPETIFDLWKMASCLVLMSLRAIVKNQLPLKNMFLKTKIVANMQNILLIKEIPHYIAPCEEYISMIQLYLNKNSYQARMLYTVLLNRYVIERRKAERADTNLIAFFRFCFITQTSYNGLLLIKYLEQIRKDTKLSVDDLINYTYYQQTKESWKTIRRFQESLLKKDNYQYCAYWCRIISVNIWLGLNSSQNIVLLTVFRGMIRTITNDESIYNAFGASKANAMYPFAMTLGERLGNMTAKSGRPELGSSIKRVFVSSDEVMRKYYNAINRDEKDKENEGNHLGNIPDLI